MFVCIVARGIPSSKYRMNGIFEYDQAKALVAGGIRVVYIALDLRSLRRWRKWGIHRSEQDGMTIYRVNVPVGAVSDKMLCDIGRRKLVGMFGKVVKKDGKPDLLHAHFTHQAYMTTFVAEKYQIPLIVTEHSAEVNREAISKDIYDIAAYSYNKANLVISVSQALKKKLDDRFHIDCRVISNIINFDCFKLIPPEKSGDFRFISVGGLVPEKKMDLLIESFHLAFENQPDVSLVIFGEGPERKKLEEKIIRYNMQQQIFLKGLQTRESIYQEMRECRCFVLASETETFGVAYTEAMASGLPVIATKCGGPEEFVNDKNGLLIPVNDVQSLKAALVEMKENIAEYNSKDISDYILHKYSNESIVTQLVSVYGELIGEKELYENH